ncbi:arylesterase [Moritella viscosa]|uniref:Acyl-CoA thioesterase I n=1 Tax=Moritella viscosa TaxID=80854 RepID=A0A1L0C952_9GAMM|nr:arylesterase [Moritella viscosa]SGZ04178.1 Acyl-CoA thioesterase I [Moritella viscosa]SGZ17107.1 Acyl-CoA thioesterase I [Moritella viscosa]SGZ18631.1 Acyl-CoA thioesterase I [Moritella viscosa]SHN99161.1 Acyl-CoA thioesterase I [Moritella viscosa]SHN99162.1 Acyl-CoA thioesterase I [Moritella viscosa]
MFKNAFKVLLLIVILLPAAYATANHKILLLGDSLSASYGMTQSEGWVTLLNQQLVKQNAPYNIINASISGETTAGGLSRLPGILAKQSIDALIIELGGNDGLRGFSPKLIKKNLTKMVELAHAQNIPVYVMNIRIPPNYGPRYSKMFTDVFTQVGSEKDITVLPFFMEQIAIDPSLMQNDGIHPNRTAQPKIADIMSKQLAVIYSEHN